MDQSNQTEAVFKSSRNEVDPVSGNEVPAGALPEEVRDDVPAMLSEGEYVVPADVLRYYGVKFFEDLRNEAKMGLTEMDAGGRIGGEPVEGGDDLPFSDEELMAIDDGEEATPGFAEGGLNIPSYVNAPDMSAFGLSMGEPTGGVEFRTYVNSNGMEITIPFFDGEPLGAIPAGYSLKSDATEAVREESKQERVEPEGGRDGLPDGPARDNDKSTSSTDSQTTSQSNVSKSDTIAGLGKVAKGVLTGNPVAAINGLTQAVTGQTIAEHAADVAFGEGDVRGGRMSMTDGLGDTNNDGRVGFADTWGGDLLGLDGKVGVQGPNLRASRGGARNAPMDATGSGDRGGSASVGDSFEGGGYSDNSGQENGNDFGGDEGDDFGGEGLGIGGLYKEGGLVKKPKKKKK